VDFLIDRLAFLGFGVELRTTNNR